MVNEEIYHIFTRSIADYVVFNNDSDFERMRQLFQYYTIANSAKYSDFIASKLVGNEGFYRAFNIVRQDKENLVQKIAYCFMPTHTHFILKQLAKNGISKYMQDILNSYTRYFNTVHKRKGPLWESRFKSVLVTSDEQLLHLTRYLHLNPVTAKLVDSPDKWPFSSYNEYLSRDDAVTSVCQFNDILEIKPFLYRKFVCDRIAYQRELAKIKKLMID